MWVQLFCLYAMIIRVPPSAVARHAMKHKCSMMPHDTTISATYISEEAAFSP